MRRYLYNAYQTFGRRRSAYTLLSFMIPFVAMAMVFAVQQVHPFGDKMILTVDLYHQYAPFAIELRNKLLSGDSLAYSWNIGLGSNFLATFANYAASPLNILLLLFPTKYIPDGIAFVVCVRAGLSGLFMSFLLRDIDRGRKDMFLCAFASVYALCGWVLSYFWNIMWMDAVMLLPLIVFGMRRMFRDRKPFLYVVSLFLCLWSNFFTGYFVCVFLVLYAPVCYVTTVDKKTPSNFFGAVGRFSLYSLIGGGMAGVLLYPTYVALGHASATGDAFPKDYNLTYDMFDFFSRFFLGSNPNIRDGMANVYSGIFVLLLIPLFFLCSRISFKEKMSYGILLLIMYFSFASRILNFIWHGFHFPNQIPYRQAFLMSFLLVIIGYRVIRNLKSFVLSDITLSVFIIFSYLVLYEKIGEGSEGFRAIALTGLFTIIYAVILRAIILAPRSQPWHRVALFGVILAELIVASQVTVALVSMNEGFTGWHFYGMKEPEVTAFLDEKESTSPNGPFVRAEVYPAYICNQPAMYKMRGLSIFSSTARETQVKFMKSLGLHTNGINSTRNYGLTEVTASLFGIRYMIDLETASAIPSVFDQEEENEYGLRIMSHPDALSLGYMVAPDVLDYEIAKGGTNVFATSNDFLKALGLDPVYRVEEIEIVQENNVTFRSGSGEAGYSFSLEKDKDEVFVVFSVIGEPDGRQLYVFEDTGKNVNAEVLFSNADSSETSLLRSNNRSNQIIDMGRATESAQTMKMTWKDEKGDMARIYCYSVDPVAYAKMTARLGSSQMKITEAGSTRIAGEVNVSESGVLLLTMTYDEGWKAWVDGKPTEIHNIAGALCGIPLEAGEHEIILKFEADGMKIGIAISIGSIILLIAMILIRNFPKYRKTDQPAVFGEGPETDPEYCASVFPEKNMPDSENPERADTAEPERYDSTEPERADIAEPERMQ